jgi:hypothetical protein
LLTSLLQWVIFVHALSKNPLGEMRKKELRAK